MGRMSRNKGAEGERELAKEIMRLFGVPARRGRQFCGDPTAPDVKTEIDGIHWECKRAETLSLYNALEQADGDRDWEEIPVVAHRKNRQPWVAIVRLDDLPRLVKMLAPFVKDE